MVRRCFGGDSSATGQTRAEPKDKLPHRRALSHPSTLAESIEPPADSKGEAMRVRDMMTREVVSATPETSVLDLAALMLDYRVSAIQVLSGDSLS